MTNNFGLPRLLALMFLVINISGCDPFADLYFDNATGQYMNGKQFRELHPDYHGE